MTQIRNIIQSAPSREIIKTAPDMVVYIDGLPFFINPYLKDDSSNYTTINFNDYITAIATSYNVDNLIPSGSINLSVPNGSKQLFMAPGGGLLIDTMSEIRIYAKSYFYSETGNTVYRRVFNGMIKSIDYNETNTSLEIAISIVGILHLMELMQTDRAPATMSNSGESQTPKQTVDADKNPYEIIVATFKRAMDYSGFLKTAIGTKEQKIVDSALAASLKANFIAKWQERLTDLRKYVHLYGYKSTVAEPEKVDPKVEKAKNTKDPAKASGATPTNVKDETRDYLTNAIRRHLPEFTVGTIQLFGGKIMPRLEIIRAVIESIGYEGYQDVDGSIIIKPPLYNLDSTIIGDTSKIKDENLSDYSNPFIIHLSEVLGENYMEDESGIRRTRMTVQGSLNPHGYGMGLNSNLRAVASFIDVNLVRKYGIRDEAPRQLNFLASNSKAIFAFAAMELVKLNKNFRTYHVTIPLRPEMRLGFPIFVPHLDMYAYVAGIAISYNVGGRADMSLTCNFIRKRPQFPTYQKTEKGEPIIVYASQPNLVHKWTKEGGSTIFNSTKMNEDLASLLVTGSPATIHNPFKPTDEQNAIDTYVKKKLGNLFETHTDSKDMNWTIQKDDDKFFGEEFDIDNVSTEKPAGKKIVLTDGPYLDKLTQVQPFTDEKGYEVITPFAWGRYSSVSEAIYEFTRGGMIEDSRGVDSKSAENKALLKTSSAFLYAGMATPLLAPTTASQLKAVTEQTGGSASKIVGELQLFDRSNVISFEMDFTGENRLNNDSTQLEALRDSADTSNVIDVTPAPSATSEPSALQRAEAFLAGTQDYLKSVLNEGSNGNSDVSLLPQNTDLGTYATPGSISSSLSKIQATWVNLGKGTVE